MKNLFKFILIFMIDVNFCFSSVAEERVVVRSSGLIVNVKDCGAVGDGDANDTAAFRLAVSKLKGVGGTVLIPDGVYMIDAVKGVDIESDTKFSLAKAAVIKAIPNNSEYSTILRIKDASNVRVSGGVIIGERYHHNGSGGEWGMGISIIGSRKILIDNVVVKDNWGDGFYISGSSRDVVLRSVTADNNRRQGVSVISVDGLVISDSSFINTNGTAPHAGIDIEPNPGDSVANVRIENSKILGNKGWGIQLTLPNSIDYTESVRNVSIENNYISGNRVGGVGVLNVNEANILNNTIEGNINHGVYFSKNTTGSVLKGNRLSGKARILDLGKNLIHDN